MSLKYEPDTAARFLLALNSPRARPFGTRYTRYFDVTPFGANQQKFALEARDRGPADGRFTNVLPLRWKRTELRGRL